ncbi:uncharacterized protein [Clytia hemisphaerica]|uniref:uncharacterized protein n=1 Tax=Clytia hemisphaerica TaxID=252671 RepID=UPI0034D670D8
MKVLNSWCNESTIKEIATAHSLHKTMVSDMCRHFRLACQTWLVETKPLLLRGEGKHVMVEKLKDCVSNDQCEICIIYDTENDVGYLLHNTDNRYTQQWVLPVKRGTFVFSDKVLNIPAGCPQSQTIALFQGNNTVDKANHAKKWIKKKCGVSCPNAGATLSEYNFRHFFAKNQELGDKMVNLLKDIYEPVFLQ